MPGETNNTEIITLYKKTVNEITRYRDLEWKISLWAYSVSLGLISLSNIGQFSPPSKLAILLFSIIILIFSMCHLIFCHWKLTEHRRLLRNCELKLPDLNEILPNKWKKSAEDISFKIGIWHFISWIFLNVIITFIVIIIYYGGDEMIYFPDWVTWGAFVGIIGFIVAITTFFWKAKDRYEIWKKGPKLEINRYNEWNGRWVILNGSRYNKFHCIHVKNNGTISAKRCVAKLKIIEKPNSVTNLDVNEEYKIHWADKDNSYRTDEPEPIDIGSEFRRLDVFFSQSSTPNIPPSTVNINDFFPSSMGGTILPYSSHSAESVNTSETEESPTNASPSPPTTTSNPLDSWIAIPIALSNPVTANNVYLHTGNYRVKIRIDWEKGDGIEKEFNIVITSNGQNNSLDER